MENPDIIVRVASSNDKNYAVTITYEMGEKLLWQDYWYTKVYVLQIENLFFY